jgi:hypothetical protein
MKNDPAIERVRKARHEISAECDHDPKKLVAYYQERARKRQEREGGREEKKKYNKAP